jgi:hypothetical protein
MNLPHQACRMAIVLAALIFASALSAADQSTDTSRQLEDRMSNVIIAEPLTAAGATCDQQFCDILQKIADRYAEKWMQPLPIQIDFVALQKLRSSSTDLNAFIGLVLRDAPLPETLRGWCVRADLTFTVTHGAIVITTEPQKSDTDAKK